MIVRVKRGGGGPIGGAFVAHVQHEYQSQGHTGVFIRAGGETRRELIPVRVGRKIKLKRVKQLPIDQLFGPSVPQMIKNPQVVTAVEQKATETLEKRLDHEISRALKES